MESSDFDLLYNYFLSFYINRRNVAIQLLSDRNFDKLNNGYIHFYNKKEKEIILISHNDYVGMDIDFINNELTNIRNNIKINETIPHLCVRKIDYEPDILVRSYLYTIVPVSICENLAKYSANSAIFKINNQPNGKDAKGYIDILNK